MQTRKIGPFDVPATGLGCMNLRHAYGTLSDPAAAGGLLLELGYTFFDTVATKTNHLTENITAADIALSDDILAWLDNLINADAVRRARYNTTSQAEIDTKERFA